MRKYLLLSAGIALSALILLVAEAEAQASATVRLDDQEVSVRQVDDAMLRVEGIGIVNVAIVAPEDLPARVRGLAGFVGSAKAVLAISVRRSEDGKLALRSSPPGVTVVQSTAQSIRLKVADARMRTGIFARGTDGDATFYLVLQETGGP